MNHEAVNNVLAHYGVKGMKWGVRSKGAPVPTVSVETEPGKKLKTSGGTGRKASDDAVRAAVGLQVAKKSGIQALSNKELQEVVTRMNLERQYKSLKVDRANPAAKFISKLLVDTGKQQVSSIVTEQARKAQKRGN